MTGPAEHARDVDVAARARADLDATDRAIAAMESSQRVAVATLVRLWPDAAWLAAGARSAKDYLVAYTGLSFLEARRLARIAELCTRDERLLAAVVGGSLSLGRAEKLSRAVTPERAPFLDQAVDAFLSISRVDDDGFDAALRLWRDLVDQELAPRRVQDHSLTVSRRLFGGGEVHASLAPVDFAHFLTAIDAFTQDPDPADAPYQRTLSERRADAAGDMACAAMTTGTDDGYVDPDDDVSDSDDGDDGEARAEDEVIRAGDTFDGSYPGDTLDEALDPDNEGLDELELLRLRIRKAEVHQRRRAMRQIRARSGVTVNVLIDLKTLAEARTLGDLGDLVMAGDGWNLAKNAAEQMLCDASLVATLFEGKTRVLDANDAAERFSKRQRRAIAARDRHCVFPGCTRIPRHCDVHHLHERADGGPTTTANGCLLCRFHHRLLHQHGWKLHRDATTDRWVATDPHGQEWKGRPTQPAAA